MASKDKKILIIKFAAIGDVLRTTPLLLGLKDKYPNSRISWVTLKEAAGILKGNSLINRPLIFNKKNVDKLRKENFDLLISLDKDKSAISLAELIPAAIKKGYGVSLRGKPRPFDKDSNYAYRLGVDDSLKFRINKNTYQQIIFQQAGLRYKGQPYVFSIAEKEKKAVYKRLLKIGVKKDKVKIGIATGSGKAFAGKKLKIQKYIGLIKRLAKDSNLQILLLGGKREKKRNKRIKLACNDKIIDTGCDNSIGQYAAIIDNCDVVFTGDTLTLHLAIALKKMVVAFFASTCQQEIDIYGRGEKIISDLACSPCYKRICPIDEECMKRISVEQIYDAIIKVLKNKKT